jgi:cytochrome c peroxidase
MTEGATAPCETATSYEVSTATFTDVWRSVPSVLNVSLSGNDSQPSIWARGPNPQGGYQLDGRVDTLQNQALGALLSHAQVATAPGVDFLDDIAAYENGLVATDEPPLDDLETMGKAVFDRACSQCHNGSGMSTPLTGAPTIIRFHDDFTGCPRPVDFVSPARWNMGPCAPSIARNAQTYEISFADGFKLRRTSSDPGRALLSGFVFSGLAAADGSCLHAPCGPSHLDDWQKFEIAPLHGISQTAPYFHNNSAATLEDVVIHYEEFFKLSDALNPLPLMPPLLTTDGVHRDRPNIPAERAALVAYLEKL